MTYHGVVVQYQNRYWQQGTTIREFQRSMVTGQVQQAQASKLEHDVISAATVKVTACASAIPLVMVMEPPAKPTSMIMTAFDSNKSTLSHRQRDRLSTRKTEKIYIHITITERCNVHHKIIRHPYIFGTQLEKFITHAQFARIVIVSTGIVWSMMYICKV